LDIAEVMRLFSAVLHWLDLCIPFLKLSDSNESGKQLLYVELASCLLAYINDVLAAVRDR